MDKLLFTPYRMREIELVNRIVVSPMAQYSADAEGRAGDWHLMHLGNLSVSGAGLLILEATAVEPCGRVSPSCLGLWSDEHVKGLERIVSFARTHGETKIGIQLAHAGRKASVSPPWRGGKDVPPDEGGWNLVGPSNTPYPGRRAPSALDRAAMDEMTACYVAAASRADAAGFDLVELHCAHGYLLNSFLSPLANDRSDSYGGSFENRMRYPLEVFRAVREAWPPAKPMGMRVSASDWVEGGWTVEDSVVLAQRLKDEGCDYVAASSGGNSPGQKITVGPGYQVPFAARIRHGADMPSIAVGHIWDGPQAEAILSESSADLIAVGRGMTYNPRWAWHAAEQLGAEAPFPPQYARSHPSMRRLPR